MKIEAFRKGGQITAEEKGNVRRGRTGRNPHRVDRRPPPEGRSANQSGGVRGESERGQVSRENRTRRSKETRKGPAKRGYAALRPSPFQGET